MGIIEQRALAIHGLAIRPIGERLGPIGFHGSRRGGRAQLRREVLDSDFTTWREYRESPAEVHELANVSGPRVRGKLCFGLRGQRLRFDAQLMRRHIHVVMQQIGDVFRAGAQRRQLDPNHVQAVIQIFAKQSTRYAIL